MSLKPEKLGAEPKKIAILAALLLVAGYFYFSSSNSNDSATAPAPSARSVPQVEKSIARPASREARTARNANSSSPREFRPVFKTKNIDPSDIDPTLHLNLLAKLKKVTAEAGTRSLFDIAAAPPAELKVKEPDKIELARKLVGPMQPGKGADAAAASDPKAPPIPLKFYGFVNPPKAGIKRAFFLDGEEIIIAGEGDLVKKRYKIVRIGVNSAVVQDTQFKSNNEQTLPLEAELAG